MLLSLLPLLSASVVAQLHRNKYKLSNSGINSYKLYVKTSISSPRLRLSLIQVKSKLVKLGKDTEIMVKDNNRYQNQLALQAIKHLDYWFKISQNSLKPCLQIQVKPIEDQIFILVTLKMCSGRIREVKKGTLKISKLTYSEQERKFNENFQCRITINLESNATDI